MTTRSRNSERSLNHSLPVCKEYLVFTVGHDFKEENECKGTHIDFCLLRGLEFISQV